MKRAAVTLIAGLLLAGCGSSGTPSTHTTASTGTTSSQTWHGLRRVRITTARPGLPPPYSTPKTKSFTTPAQLAKVTAALNRFHIGRLEPPSSNQACAGGTRIAITIVGPSRTDELNAYRCGGRTTGEVFGDLAGFLATVGLPS